MERLSLVFNKYIFWIVLGLSIFIPLYPKFPLFNVPGTYVAVRIEDFLIALVALVWIITQLPNIRKLLKENITQAFLIFWGIGALSLFSGITLTHSVLPQLGLFHLLRRIEFMILFFIALTTFTKLWQVKTWLVSMLIVTIIVIIYGFGQQWLNFPVISTTNKEFSKGLILFLTPDARVNSTFAGHYDLAVFLMFFIILAVSHFLYFKKIIQKIILIGVSGLAFLLLAMTAARVSFFAMLAGVVLLFWITNNKKYILALVFLTLFAFAISPELRHRTVATFTVNIYGGGGPKYEPPPQKQGNTTKFSIENAVPGVATPSGVPIDVVPGEPLNTTELGVYRSLGIRFDVEWPRAIRAFLKNPFLGTGYSSITITTDNDFLRSLGEVGILGTFSLALIFFIIFKKIWNFTKTSAKDQKYFFLIGVLCGLLALFLNATFIDVLESSKVAELLWITLGIAFATTRMQKA